jgi:5-methylcytosine-specific restriction endonuclease McrA
MKEIKRIISDLVSTGKWSEEAAHYGIRAGFKCEYCDRDLLASVNDYKEWQEDHIIPSHAGGKYKSENIAVACRTCNVNIKGKWNPAEVCKKGASRDELIQATRVYIQKRRAEMLKEVSLFNSIVYDTEYTPE